MVNHPFHENNTHETYRATAPLYRLDSAEAPAMAGLDNMTARHPCYSRDAAHTFSRIHLPVAPRCNVACNYCLRRFDCLHESRPGVSSQVMSPVQAQQSFRYYRSRLPHLSVAGIAGPGDALANWNETRQTLELILSEAPQIMLCLSTNGLKLPDLAADIIGLGVRHVTVTVNTLKSVTAAAIYRYVNYRGSRYSGLEAGELLIGNQLDGIRQLVGLGALVKINTVLIPGINVHEVAGIAGTMGQLGAAMMNIIPFKPVKGSRWQDHRGAVPAEVNSARQLCSPHIEQMSHCQQCRADAVGLLGRDRHIMTARIDSEGLPPAVHG